MGGGLKNWQILLSLSTVQKSESRAIGTEWQGGKGQILTDQFTRSIITRGLYTFYPLFEVNVCTVTFGHMYGQYSRAVSNQERVIMSRIWYSNFLAKTD